MCSGDAQPANVFWISVDIFDYLWNLRMSFPKGKKQYNDWMQMKKYEIIKTSR